MMGTPLVTALHHSLFSVRRVPVTSLYFSKFVVILYLVATVGIFDLHEVKTIIIFELAYNFPDGKCTCISFI